MNWEGKKLPQAALGLLVSLGRERELWISTGRKRTAATLVALGLARWVDPYWISITRAGRERIALLKALAKRGVGRGAGAIGRPRRVREFFG